MHLERKPESKLPGPAAKLKQFIEQRPLAQEGVRDVLKLIKACSTEDLVELGLHPPPLPVLGPILSSQQALPARLHSVQDVISSLQYNHMPGYYFNVSKARPLPSILATAAAILRDPLPIKCIEAVFLGLLLTQGFGGGQLQRMPVGFKSMGADSQVYRHIVLVVHDPESGLFGGLGMSRRANLMYKPLAFQSLAELIADYQAAYSGWGHQLVKVRVGLPVEHDSSYTGPVCWRYCTVNLHKRPWGSIAAILDQHAAAAAKLQAKFRVAAARTSGMPATGNANSSSPGPQPHITRPYQAARAGTTSCGMAVAHSCHPAGASPFCSHAGGNKLNTDVPASPRLRSQTRPMQVGTAVPGTSCPVNTVAQRSEGPACTSSSCSGSSSGCACIRRVAAATGCQQECSAQEQQQQHQTCLSPGCRSSSDDEADFDSDSEVNAIVDSMRHSPRHGHMIKATQCHGREALQHALA